MPYAIKLLQFNSKMTETSSLLHQFLCIWFDFFVILGKMHKIRYRDHQSIQTCINSESLTMT